MNETLKTIESLRTVRSFSERDITDEKLSRILNSCVKAASASARQTYSIIVVDDKSVMKEIGYTGNKMLVFCVDYNRIADTAEFLGYQFSYQEAVSDFVTGSTDTVLAAQTAAIAAKSLGIDSLFTNCLHRGNIDRIYKLLNLPEKYCFPLIALILGYADESKLKTTGKGRLSGPGVIHYGKYHRLKEEEINNIVLEYDAVEKHYLSLIAGWRDKGYGHYLDYFYEVWCGFLKRDGENETKRKIQDQYPEVEKVLVKAGFLREM